MFTYVHDNKGETPAIEEYPVGSTAISMGEPLKLSSGKLVNIGGATTKPEFIAHADAAANAASAPVIKVTPTQKWRSALSASNSTAAYHGLKYTLGGDKYDLVTATTSSGIASLLYKAADASGSEVIVRFD